MMQCNIDARGKQVRLISGLITLAAAVVLAVLAVTLGDWWWWALAGVAAAGGGFQVFEARQGWCVMRAMGFRTPI